MYNRNVLRIIVILTISLFVVSGFALDKNVNAVSSDSWPMYRGDPQRSGYSTSTAPSTNNTRWIYNATYEFDSSPSIANGRLIIGESNGDVLAINVTTGRLIWSFSTDAGQNSIWSTPAIDSGKVYIGTRNKTFYCLDETNGNQIWTFTTNAEIDSSPVVNNGKVYFSIDTGSLYCLDSSNGNLIWNTNCGSNGFETSPSIADNTVYFTYHNSAVALNAQDGTLLWNTTFSSSTTSGTTCTSPVYSNSKIFFGYDSSPGSVYCLRTTDGAIIWQKTLSIYDYFYMSSPAISGNRLFICSAGGRLHCLDSSTGDELWGYQIDGETWGSPAIADGKVFVNGGDNARIYCFDLATGSVVWSYLTVDRSLSGPSICDGVVYAGCGSGFLNEKGRIYAFGTSNLSPTNIALSINSASAFLGFRVTLNGTLTSNGNAVANRPVELSYSINNGQTWNDITSVTTANDGTYSAVWVPSATGTYLVKAKSQENYPYSYCEDTKALSVTLYSDYVFSVESNSTVSALTFNSTSYELQFTVSGASGTTGQTSVTIAKSLVPDINNLKVYIDDVAQQYQTEQTSDSWIITFSYSHSTHNVGIFLANTQSSPTPTPTPSETSTIPEFSGWAILLLPLSIMITLALMKTMKNRKQSITLKT